MLKGFYGKITERMHLDGTQTVLLAAGFVDQLLCCVTYPAIRKTTAELLPVQYFAVEQMVFCGATLFNCSLWNDGSFRRLSFRHRGGGKKKVTITAMTCSPFPFVVE